LAQVTIYLEDEIAAQAKKAAAEAGLSQSRWIAELIRERTSENWPADFLKLGGAWPDFPTLDAIRGHEGEDLPREPM
jgi:hypothetical protein